MAELWKLWKNLAWPSAFSSKVQSTVQNTHHDNKNLDCPEHVLNHSFCQLDVQMSRTQHYWPRTLVLDHESDTLCHIRLHCGMLLYVCFELPEVPQFTQNQPSAETWGRPRSLQGRRNVEIILSWRHEPKESFLWLSVALDFAVCYGCSSDPTVGWD